jgi:lipoprotein-releasing system permease protein
MMSTWYEGFLGVRYLRASPRRGFVSLIGGIAMIGLALGVAVLIVVLSVMNGFEEELRTRILSLTAHATISGLEGRLQDWRRDEEKLSKFPGVVAAAPYIEEQGMVTHGSKAAGILIRGVLPDAERKVADLTPHLLSGALSDLVPGDYRVILGKDLADDLGVKVGDRVVVIVAQGDVTPLGVMPRMRAFQVVGLISVGMYEYDRRIALFAMQDAAKLLRMGDAVTGIRLNVADMYAAPRIVREAAASLGRRRRRRLQHRLDHGDGGQEQAPGHRHPAHLRRLAPQHLVGVHRAGQLDRCARDRLRGAHRCVDSSESSGTRSWFGADRGIQIPGRTRLLHDRPSRPRAAVRCREDLRVRLHLRVDIHALSGVAGRAFAAGGVVAQ